MAYTTNPVLADMLDADLSQLIAGAQAEQKRREIGTVAIESQAEVQTFINASAALTNLGVTAGADTQDGTWVRIVFPVDTAIGAEKALMLGTIQIIVQNYGGQQIDAKTVRQSKKMALSHLTLLNQLLQA